MVRLAMMLGSCAVGPGSALMMLRGFGMCRLRHLIFPDWAQMRRGESR
jgi:hypothetical protein